jgi:hypothetical protein
MRTSVGVATVLIIAGLTFSAMAQHRKEDQPLPDDLYQLYLTKSEVISRAIKKLEK